MIRESDLKKREKIIKSIARAMVCVAFCDKNLDSSEEVVLERFAKKYNIKISLRDKKTLERITLDYCQQ